MSEAKTIRPAATEFAPYYGIYIGKVPEGNVVELLVRQSEETFALLRGLDEERSKFRYEPGKWSIREVIGHIADTERVFTYRALSFARGDESPLPSMDQTVWMGGSNAHQRSIRELAAELAAVRAASVALFQSFTDEQMSRAGVASGNRVTVRALAFITAGHERHHVGILRERYGL